MICKDLVDRKFCLMRNLILSGIVTSMIKCRKLFKLYYPFDYNKVRSSLIKKEKVISSLKLRESAEITLAVFTSLT